MDGNELGLGSEVQGRMFHVCCTGDNAGEIEIAALTAAQEFFGDSVPLEIVQNYHVVGLLQHEVAECGKKYQADVMVCAPLR